MQLNDLLVSVGLDPSCVIVLRHRPWESALNKVFPFLAAERPDLFNAFQSAQGEKLEASMQSLSGIGYVASFIAHGPQRAIFVGLYKIGVSRPVSYEQFWSKPANQELRRLGFNGFDGDRPSILWFDLALIPLRAGLVAGQENIIDVLVRVRAPASPAAAKPPAQKNIAFVIDRSGSMSGPPLEEAKRCVMQIIDSMAPTDCASIIAYNNRVDVVAPLQPVADRAALKALIGAIGAGGNTALYAGWHAGAQSLDDIAHGTGISRVLLLSDGQANNGLTEPVAIAAQCAAFATRGVTTSTCGLGHDFNEELISAMAQAGGGTA